MTVDELDQGSLLLGRMGMMIADAGLLLETVQTLDPADVEARCYALGFVVNDFMDVAEKIRDYLQGVLETATREHVEALLGDVEGGLLSDS